MWVDSQTSRDCVGFGGESSRVEGLTRGRVLRVID